MQIICVAKKLGIEGVFKRTDDHIFEKILKTELSPIPQAYTLKPYYHFYPSYIMATTNYNLTR
jgi:hypothetical protein